MRFWPFGVRNIEGLSFDDFRARYLLTNNTINITTSLDYKNNKKNLFKASPQMYSLKKTDLTDLKEERLQVSKKKDVMAKVDRL